MVVFCYSGIVRISRFLLIKFCLISIFINCYSYEANIESSLKVGNKRNLGRLGVVLPVYEINSDLLYITGIGLFDSKDSLEGNFGLGYRRLSNKNIYSVYGYYDVRRSELKNTHHQLTFGLEWMQDRLELRANGYVPLSTDKSVSRLSSIEIKDRVVYGYTDKHTETGMHGYDFECGGNAFNRLRSYVSYYHFGAKDVKSIDGLRL